MKYSIISINDKRAKYKEAIRAYAGYEEIIVASIDGQAVDLNKLMKAYGLKWTDWTPTAGEAGVWLSNYLRWYRVTQMNEPLIVFEDDAIIGPAFTGQMEHILPQLPPKWDFVSLWVPDNQRQDYLYDLTYDENGEPIITGRRTNSLFDIGQTSIAKVYQGYGMVATMYSPEGGKKLMNLTKKHGIYTPVDCFLMQQAHRGKLNGYAPKPFHTFVSYDWPETQIHNTEKIK